MFYNEIDVTSLYF